MNAGPTCKLVPHGSCRETDGPVRVDRLGVVDYAAAREAQRAHAAARTAGTGPDVLMLLEHPSVYTAGKRTRPEHRPTDGTPVVDTDRGGAITWHGPGQLVGYPVVALRDRLAAAGYVARLEGALVDVCRRSGVVGAHRITGRPGVWVPGRAGRPAAKIAAIGVRMAGHVTQHGFALNCDADLSAFDAIVPCGLTDATVTSLTVATGRRIGVDDVRELVAHAVVDALDRDCPDA
ncbi:lipoyl(octanoyl) transferase LipB [Pseudonocardia sp.]|jgi:lipoyl(octanoyl) transferase|uniref:lipoyl(octanoyl) transferase LipB n=1 Tax=Pseudonocardia sp. TaxID=60912 RepID=UPI003D105F9D